MKKEKALKQAEKLGSWWSEAIYKLREQIAQEQVEVTQWVTGANLAQSFKSKHYYGVVVSNGPPEGYDKTQFCAGCMGLLVAEFEHYPCGTRMCVSCDKKHKEKLKLEEEDIGGNKLEGHGKGEGV